MALFVVETNFFLVDNDIDFLVRTFDTNLFHDPCRCTRNKCISDFVLDIIDPVNDLAQT